MSPESGLGDPGSNNKVLVSVYVWLVCGGLPVARSHCGHMLNCTAVNKKRVLHTLTLLLLVANLVITK